MASSLRLGMTRPTATATTASSCLLRPTPPQPSSSLLVCSIPAARLFSTTPAALRRVGYPHQGVPRDQHGQTLPIPKPHARDDHIPEYPYGPRKIYKQSNTGLYGTARIRFGNNVSEKHDVKTPRKWRPNLQRRRLWSEALRCFVQTRVTTRVLRTIDKCGGLDEYLLGHKAQRIKDLGPWGWKLRWRIMQSDVLRERFVAERKRLGLREKTRLELDVEMADRILKEIEATGEGSTGQQALVEMDRMIESGEEFTLGEPESPRDEGFMKEERR